MATVQHQICVINHRPLLFCKRLDHGFFRIVNQDDDVREFNRRPSPDAESRRNPLRDRALGCADQGGGALRIVVCLQIHCDDQPKPCPPRGRPLHKHAALRKRSEHTGFLILFHMAPDLLCQLLLLRLSQVVFRQNHPQRGRGRADNSVRFLPVGRLGGILIAGDNRPLLIVCPFLWKLDPGDPESHLTECMHAVILHLIFCDVSGMISRNPPLLGWLTGTARKDGSRCVHTLQA